MGNIKVVIADDHVLFIEGLKVLLQDETDFSIVDTATNGKELLSVVSNQKVDIVLLDINMPGMNGLEATEHIRHIDPQVKIIILSTYGEHYLIEKARQCGANGYLIKTTPKDELVATIYAVYHGTDHFHKKKKVAVSSEFARADQFLKQYYLTKRELEIVGYLKHGMTSREIAEKLFLSVLTVKTHRKNILQKLELPNTGSLMRFIMENGL